MSRFSGRVSEPPEVEEEITVQVKANLTLNLWVESEQINKAQTVLVTGSETIDDKTEKLIGVDGVSGLPVEITIHLGE